MVLHGHNGTTDTEVELWIRIDNISTTNIKAQIEKNFINVNEINEI